MAWEQRGNKTYYYRKQRQGDRVISEYVGTGELAQTAADIDALERELRHAQRRQRQARRALDAQVDQACRLIGALTYSVLLTAGYHTHKGQWRKKRHG
jgi:hypothetical protein